MTWSSLVVVCVAGLMALGAIGRTQDGMVPQRRLRVSDNRRFLVKGDGSPFFWLADTAWELFHRLDRAEAELYLSDRAAKGFTVIQAVALAELDGLNTPNRYGHLPLADNDPSRPATRDGPGNDYWDFVDEVIDLAAARGLYVGLLPAWGKYVTSDAFNGKVNGIFNVENARAYGQFIGRRYRDRWNIVWILGGDKAPSTPQAVAIWRAMAAGIAHGAVGGEDCRAVLMTYHTSGPGHASDYLHDEPWLGFTSLQSSHGDKVINWRYIQRHWNRQPIKPVIDLESSYPGLLIPAKWLPMHMRADHPSTQPSDDHDARRAAYWAVFSGAAGHTYGHHAIWQMNSAPPKPGTNALPTWREALDAPSAAQMGHLRRLIESRPFLTHSPRQELLADGEPQDPMAHVAALHGRGYAMVYTPMGGPFRVRLDLLGWARTKAWWYDVRAGRAEPAGEFAADGVRLFEPPGTPGKGNDRVLVLDDAAAGFAVPGMTAAGNTPPPAR